MRKFWTVRKLAEHLQVPNSWVYDRTRESGPDLIPHLKLGKYVRFDPASRQFQAWLKAQRVADQPPGDQSADRRKQDRESELSPPYTEGSLSDRTSRRKGVSQ